MTSKDEFEMKVALKYAETIEYRMEIWYIAYIVIAVLAAVGVLGNFLIIYYFVRKYKRNIKAMSSYHFLIVLLALIDGLACILQALSYHFEWQQEWRLDDWSCVYGLNYIRLSFPNLSFWTLLLISYERYRNICRPFDGKTSRRKYAAVIVAMFFACSGLPFLADLAFEYRVTRLRGPDRPKCVVDLAHLSKTRFHVSILSTAFIGFSPLGLMIFYYRKISNYMRNEEKNSHNEGQVAERIRKRNKRALRIILLLVVIFFITSVPSRFVFYVYLQLFFDRANILVLDWGKLIFVEYFTIALSIVNFAVNFIVYAFMIKGFRQFLLNVLTFGLRWRCVKRDR